MTDWNNKEEVLEAVREDGYTLEQASEELRADREVVLAAVKESGLSLQYASKELRADKEVVMAVFDIDESMSNNGEALEYASEELKADKEVVMEALSSAFLNFKSQAAFDIGDTLLRDKAFMMEALEFLERANENVYILIIRADQILWKDKDFVLEAVGAVVYAFEHKNIIFYQNVIEDYFNELNDVLKRIDNSLKSDPAIVLEAAKWDVQAALDFADENLKKDPEFMKEVEQYLTD